MFRKSVFIMFFVCLLAPVAMAAYPWDNQLEWKSNSKDANWYEPANWSQEGTLPCPPDGPNGVTYCAVLPNQPGPRIGMADAPGGPGRNSTCSMLSLNPWDPTSWGGQDVNVIVDACALDVNFGSAIQINSQVDYDSYLGGSTLVSRAILNVYGGTVYTDLNGGTGNTTGVTVGGGGSNFGMSYGMLNIYGGFVNVPRAVLNFGEIGLYGGTLQVNSDGNFAVNTTNPGSALNKVRIDGGTLILAGNHITDINALRTTGYILCDRGTMRDPVYDGSAWTTLIADINYCVWQPTPANGATNVHYKVNPYDANDPCSITLIWQQSTASTLNPIDANYDVYFGTAFADVNTATKTSPAFQGSTYDSSDPCDPCDPCSFTIKAPYKFTPGTAYYWRVDETITSNGAFKKGLVWSFTTHDGKAYNPKPVNDANTGRALDAALQLTWTAGDWTQTANGHQVYFGTNYSAVNNAKTTNTDGQYRGLVSNPAYPLTSLLGNGPNPPGASWTIQAGTTYYWRVDEVNGTTVYSNKNVGTWAFTPAAYLNIDDFEGDNSTDDVNANWPNGYVLTGCSDCNGYAGRLLIRDSSGKYMQYSYNNNAQMQPGYGGTPMAFSEAKHSYSSATSFTGGGVVFPAPKALRVDYKGTATNAANMPNFKVESDTCDMDRMYVAIEDSAGHVSVYLNPDANAQLIGSWTSWYVRLTDINAWGNTNLNAITGFAIGFGERCTSKDNGSDAVDANSIVMFDNIRLYGPSCVPQYGPTADLDGDCDVDINDLDALANDWLSHAENYVFSPCTQPAKAPILWYKFDDAGGTDQNSFVSDYGTGDANNYTGTITGFLASGKNWKTGGGRNGQTCLYLPPPGGCYVDAPVSASTSGNALGFMGDANHNTADGGGISFSIWINADLTANNMKSQWDGVFGVWNAAVATETLEVECPAPTTPWTVNFQKRSPYINAWAQMTGGDFGGRWNHWAFTKSPDHILVYCNGNLVAHTDANEQPGDVNANEYGPLFSPAVGAFRIGTRGGNWGMWNGYIQDFQVYDYTLAPAEVAWLATDGSGHIFLPLVSPANINTDGVANPATDVNQIVNFADIATMGKQWHTMILWP